MESPFFDVFGALGSVLEVAGDGATLSAYEGVVELDALGLGAGVGDGEGATCCGEGGGTDTAGLGPCGVDGGGTSGDGQRLVCFQSCSAVFLFGVGVNVDVGGDGDVDDG